MPSLRTCLGVALITFGVGSSHAQTSFAKILTVAAKLGAGYNVSQTTQKQFDNWLINQPTENFIVTAYKNEQIRYPTGTFQSGSLTVVLTMVVDGQLGTDTITIESKTYASTPDNGVRTSSNTISFASKSFANYQAWLAAVQNPVNQFTPVKFTPTDTLTFKGPTSTMTLGPNQAFGTLPGSATSSSNTAVINTPLGFFLKLVVDTKVP